MRFQNQDATREAPDLYEGEGSVAEEGLLAGGVTTQMSTRCITLCRFISTQPSPISLRSMFLSVILYFVEAVPFKEGDKSQHCDGKRARGGNQHQW